MTTFASWDSGATAWDTQTYWDRVGTLTIEGSVPAKMCPYFSGTYSYIFHSSICPKVAAIEYYPNGAVKRVEFRQV